MKITKPDTITLHTKKKKKKQVLFIIIFFSTLLSLSFYMFHTISYMTFCNSTIVLDYLPSFAKLHLHFYISESIIMAPATPSAPAKPARCYIHGIQ